MLFIFLIILCLFIWFLFSPKSNRGYKLPPVLPGRLPISGHAHWFFGCNSTNIWHLYNNISSICTTQGGSAAFLLGSVKIYFVTDPEEAYTIANSSVEKNFIYDLAKPWLGNGLLISNGATWKAHRKIMNSAFTQKILNGLMPVFNYQARRLANDFNDQEGSFNPEPLLLRNNLETICKTSLGLDTDKHRNVLEEYQTSLKEIFEVLLERFLKIWLHSDTVFHFTFLKKRHDKVVSGLHKLSNMILENRRTEIKHLKQEEPSPDIFKPLLDEILELSMEKEVLTEKEMREELDTIIFGGHDTSATLLTYILMLIGSDQSRQEKAYCEIIEVIGDSDRDVEPEDVPKLQYLECIIKESLRLYPIGPAFTRVATKDIKTKTYTFPSGSLFLLDAYSIHRHSMWGPDANKFRPERWQNPDTLVHFQKAFSGFGIGRRTCIGKTYAMMSLKVILVHLLKNYTVTADISKLTLKMSSLLRPESGHIIKIERK